MKNSYIYLGIAVVAEVCATTALKFSDGFLNPKPLLITVVGYAVSFYFLSLTLRDLPIGVVYATWSGLGIFIISTIGWIYFKEELDFSVVVGMALIIVGICIVNLFSKSSH